MINRVDKVKFRKIQRISPSQFHSMKNCAFKSLLAEAFDKKPLLPISANAYYGTVLHTLMELILKGKIKSEEEFNTVFADQINLMEEYLMQSGFTFLIPLQKKVKDYGMKKILLKKHLKNSLEKARQPVRAEFYSERWYESNDKLIGGKIDLVIETGDDIELIDFKTGEVTQDSLDDNGEGNPEVKAGYQDQLKLYAYLYFENTGRFPTKLSVINLSKQKFSIDFSQEECKSLFEQAKALLQSTNDSIGTGRFPANPSKENCRYCLYRPACSVYLKQVQTDYTLNDVSGLIQKAVKYRNGNVSVFLESGNMVLSVANFPSIIYEEANNAQNRGLIIFNLKREAKEFFYSATKTTRIYEQH